MPLVFYFHQQFKYRSPWMPLITFSGVAYVLTGALGAAILTALWPEQMQAYLAALPEEKPLIGAIFSTTTLLVTKGMWNILEVLFAAVWWIGLGKLLAGENKAMGVLTVVLGVSTLLDAMGNIFGITFLAELGMNVYLILGMFLDPLGLMLLTLPVFLPMFEALHMDMIWVGVIVVKYIEIGTDAILSTIPASHEITAMFFIRLLQPPVEHR